MRKTQQVVDMYAPNHSKHETQTWMGPKGETEKHNYVGDFNILSQKVLERVDRKSARI